jgi:hypothetical protein
MARGEQSALERLVSLLREQGGLIATLLAPDALPLSREVDGTDIIAPDSNAPRGSGARGSGARGSDTQGSGARGSDTQGSGARGSGARGSAMRGPAQTAAAGPRARRARDQYELLVETIYEGYLLHYGASRVLAPPEADLGLLAGDRLYALGLARLVALGDTEAVAELADTITLSALAQAAGEPALAGAVWDAGARAVGWGSSAAHRHAKRLAFAGAPEAIEAMRTSAAGVLTSP